MKSILSSLLLFVTLGGQPLRSEDAFKVEPAFPGLDFHLPVAVAAHPSDKDVLFVVEKGDPDPAAKGKFLGGKIQAIEGLASGHPTKRQVLQLAVKDGDFEAGGECGLLGFAVHPKVDEVMQVFIYYSVKVNKQLHQRVSRFRLLSVKPFQVDPSSEQVLISQLDSAANHNGGDLHFGPDGFLYISCGDGGAGGDAFNNSPFINKGFHAAIYRIDVDKKTGSLAPNPHPSVVTDAQGKAFYAIPADNPFVGSHSHRGQPIDPASVRTETWATGLRNPWRFSFDPVGGRAFTGDVGQNLFEEIDLLVAGGDYGWNAFEGNHVFNQKDASGKKAPPALANLTGSQFVAPIHEYDRKLGNSVTGGVVYRGSNLPELNGAYVFGDFGSGRIFALREKNGKWESEQIAKDFTIAGFGYDPTNGDILIASLAGQVKRIVKK